MRKISQKCIFNKNEIISLGFIFGFFGNRNMLWSLRLCLRVRYCVRLILSLSFHWPRTTKQSIEFHKIPTSNSSVCSMQYAPCAMCVFIQRIALAAQKFSILKIDFVSFDERNKKTNIRYHNFPLAFFVLTALRSRTQHSTHTTKPTLDEANGIRYMNFEDFNTQTYQLGCECCCVAQAERIELHAM